MEGGRGGEKRRSVEDEGRAVVVVKTSPPAAAAAGNYKNKRDEWSEAAILTLLDAYQSKWSLRNRAKLKGSDWDDIALHVSARSTFKNPNQCKNKIESMKKKYRLESAAASAASANLHPTSSWPFYVRMDQLLKGSTPPSKVEQDFPIETAAKAVELLPSLGDKDAKKVSDDFPVQGEINNCERNDGRPHVVEGNNNNASSGDGDGDKDEEGGVSLNRGMRGKRRIIVEENGIGIGGEEEEEEEIAERINVKKKKKKKKEVGLGESIRMVASCVMKIEEKRMEMYRECERLRFEAEMKRAEVDLKRTQIMATTQLQIANLFANTNNNNASNSSSPPPPRPSS